MKVRYMCATAVFCGLIFWLSSQSRPPGLDWGLWDAPWMDKVGHALLYAGLTTTVSVGMWRSNECRLTAGQFWIPIAFAILYGITDEIHQRYVPERTFEVLDLLADTVGATVVQVVLYGYFHRHHHRRRVRCRSRARSGEISEED